MKPIMIPMAILVFAGLLLSGCGQKGDLYFPKDNAQKDSTQPTQTI